MPERTCPQCGKVFKRHAKYFEITKTAYCSQGCYAKSKLGVRLKDPVVAFWSKVNKTDSCWLWQGCVGSGGYGLFKVNEKSILVHRHCWELSNGMKVPSGMKVCHRCDTPLCVNPEHLFLGTTKDNRQDASRKNRLRYYPRKLTKADAEQIRMHHSHGGFSYSQLAKAFGVSKSHIGGIVKLKYW